MCNLPHNVHIGRSGVVYWTHPVIGKAYKVPARRATNQAPFTSIQVNGLQRILTAPVYPAIPLHMHRLVENFPG